MRALVLVFVLLSVSAAAEPLRMVPQQGHSLGIPAFAISRDGTLVASGSADLRVKLWDAETGALIATLRGHTQQINALAFSPDGTRLVSACGGGDQAPIREVRIWNTRTGQPIADLVGHTAWVHSTAFSPDGKLVLTGAGDGTARLWDAATGKQLQQLALNEQVYTTRFGTGYAIVVTATRVLVIDPATFHVTHEHRVESPVGAVLSPDGALLAVRSLASKVIVIDTMRGTPQRTIDTKAKEGELQFSTDGKRLHVLDAGPSSTACGSRTCGFTHVVRTIDLASGADAGVFEINKEQLYASHAAGFSTDGTRLVSRGSDQSINLWDVAQRRLLRSFTGGESEVGAVPSKDGRFAYSGSAEGIRVWNLANLALDRILPGHGRPIAISDDGRRLLVVDIIWAAKYQKKTATTTIVDSTTGAVLRTFEAFPEVDTAAFSPDGKRIVLVEWSGKVRIVDADDGHEIASAQLDPAPEKTWPLLLPHDFAFTRDGKRIYGADATGITVLDAATGTRLAHHEKDKVHEFGRDGSRAIVEPESSSTLTIVDVASGAERRTIGDAGTPVVTAAFSPDDTLVAMARGRKMTAEPRVLRVYDAATGALRMETTLEEPVYSLAFSPANTHLLVGTTDGILRYFEIKTGASIAMLARGHEWLVWNDAGYFDASRGGGDLVAAVEGVHGYRIDQLAVRNNRPDKLLQAIHIGTGEMISHYAARFDQRARRLGLDPANLAATFEAAPVARIVDVRSAGATAEVVLEATARDAPLLAYAVYVNGVPVTHDTRLSGTRQTVTVKVALVPGHNKIEASALDRKGRESMRPFRIVEGTDGARPELYFIGFGVSRYRDATYDLGFPHKDVLDLGEALRAMKGTAFADVHIHTFIDDHATVGAVASARSLVASARPIDTVVLFIAGHGLHAANTAADYYFATHELDLADLPHTAARFDAFEELLQSTPAHRKLFLMDTCESGERDPGVDGDRSPSAIGKQRGLVARSPRGLAVKTRRPYLLQRDRYIYNDLARRTGAIVLSSSRGSEQSYELDTLKNGAFTQEILNALVLGSGDVDHDGQITTGELRDYLALAVPKLTEDRQHPIVDRDNLDARIAFPVSATAAWVLTRDDPAPGRPRALRPRGGCACASTSGPDAGLLLALLALRRARRRAGA